MRAAVFRWSAIAVCAVVVGAGGFTAWRHLSANDVGFAEPIAACAYPLAQDPSVAGSCAAYEVALLTFPPILAAIILLARFALGRTAGNAALTGLALSWLPWAGFHVASRPFPRSGVFVAVGQVALALLFAAAVLAYVSNSRRAIGAAWDPARER